MSLAMRSNPLWLISLAKSRKAGQENPVRFFAVLSEQEYDLGPVDRGTPRQI